MKEFIKENWSVSLAFILVSIFAVMFYFTREVAFSSLVSSAVSGFFALATHSSKATQSIDAGTVNVDKNNLEKQE